MMKQKWTVLLVLLLAAGSLNAQKRFKDEVFPAIDSVTDIQYGEAENVKGKQEKLMLDV